jgi:hypothetical protein
MIMQTVRGVLKGIAADGTATVQLVGAGNLTTYVDGLAVSGSVPVGLLAPGADVWVDLADRFHAGDGQVVALAGVMSSSTAGAGSAQSTQSGSAVVPTDGSGNGSLVVLFPSAFAAAPTVTVGASHVWLGSGHVVATLVSVSGFTISVTGAVHNASVPVSWSATG